MYWFVIRQSCEYKNNFCTQLLCLTVLLQRKKVSPKGLTFVGCAVTSTTSLAARSVVVWV